MSGRWRAVALALILCWSPRAPAYTLVRETAAADPLHWATAALPVVMHLNDQIGAAAIPNVAPGSDPMGAIARALGKYPAVSAARFQQGTTSVASGGNDGVNIVSFADTPANRQAFEMAGGDAVVGLTLLFFSGSAITEADLLFNPALQFTTTLETDDALSAAGAFDVEAVATHELGHVLGLHHSAIESAAMWPLSSVLQRQLDADDIAGVRVLYPSDGGRGAITGHVTVAGAPAFGAQVVARAGSGAVAAGALTLADGTYRIDELPPDTYEVYVEPLDGPASAVPDVPCIRLGNLNGAGIYNDAVLTTNFPTRFVDDVVVTAGAAVPVDFSLPTGTSPVNPVQIGFATLTGGSLSASIGGLAVPIAAGSEQLVAVAGPGMDQVIGTEIDAGPGVHVDAANLQTLTFMCNNAPLPALIFGLQVDADAPAGGRSIVIDAGGEEVAFTGAVRVLATGGPEPTPTVTPPPTASPTAGSGVCTGDCDGGGKVTVNEIITLVKIVLGSATVAACPHGLPPGARVNVALIIQAVTRALGGCPLS